MRVYISGPITGNENYIEEFNDVEKLLWEIGHEPISPAAVATKLPKLTYEEHMKLDFVLLDMCDAICMIPGWEKSCGANREYGYAMAKGKKILTEISLEENYGQINTER